MSAPLALETWTPRNFIGGKSPVLAEIVNVLAEWVRAEAGGAYYTRGCMTAAGIKTALFRNRGVKASESNIRTDLENNEGIVFKRGGCRYNVAGMRTSGTATKPQRWELNLHPLYFYSDFEQTKKEPTITPESIRAASRKVLLSEAHFFGPLLPHEDREGAKRLRDRWGNRRGKWGGNRGVEESACFVIERYYKRKNEKSLPPEAVRYLRAFSAAFPVFGRPRKLDIWREKRAQKRLDKTL